MTVRKGISQVGEKANGSMLPVGTVAAFGAILRNFRVAPRNFGVVPKDFGVIPRTSERLPSPSEPFRRT
jgi:hypothetical protein